MCASLLVSLLPVLFTSAARRRTSPAAQTKVLPSIRYPYPLDKLQVVLRSDWSRFHVLSAHTRTHECLHAGDFTTVSPVSQWAG